MAGMTGIFETGNNLMIRDETTNLGTFNPLVPGSSPGGVTLSKLLIPLHFLQSRREHTLALFVFETPKLSAQSFFVIRR